jgi:putative acetyltransferase
MSWTIRPTEPSDHESVIAVVREAFSSDDRDGGEEVDIVVNTWSLDAALSGLDLIAVEDGAVIGHVLGSRGYLGVREVAAVAPLAVDSDRQGEGIGSALMTELLIRAQATGEPLVALLGLPEFYGRFGFESAGPLGIEYPPAGPGHPHFLVRRLARYDPAYRGEFTYCWERRPV